MATVAEVRLWGRTIGAVSLEEGARFSAFQYEPAFLASGIELAPITMPPRVRRYNDRPRYRWMSWSSSPPRFNELSRL
jgi:serine/threonine-protein kinase HipA